MIGCLLLAFALCAPPGYAGPAYGYGQGYAYSQGYSQAYSQAYVVQAPPPQVVYVQAQPVYYAPPIAYPGINVNLGGWNRSTWGGQGYYRGRH
jgi:hypothetical protein